MRGRRSVIAALLRVYPVTWRREYGPELEEILLARPMSVRTIANVLWSGAGQRLHAADFATFAGLAMAGVFTAQLLLAHGWATVIQESPIALPRLLVRPMHTAWYLLLLAVCGFWTHFRRRGGLASAGRAAVTLSFVAGIPVMIAGAWALVAHPQEQWPQAAWVLAAPLFALPRSWIWGLLGGAVARWVLPRNSTTFPAAHPRR